MMIRFYTLIILTYLFSVPVFAADYVVDYQNSKVSFTGQHAGNDFTGQFEKWQADISFDPENLAQSHANIIFDLSSAKTGNAMYDGTLPKSDWFNIKEYPEGKFTSRSFRKKEDGVYELTGDLTLRDVVQSVSFDFEISDLNNSPLSVKADVPIDRLAFDIGKKSDESAEWVSRTIAINIDILAHQD